MKQVHCGSVWLIITYVLDYSRKVNIKYFNLIIKLKFIARDVFEESLENILTARDFGLVYNAYVQFDEEMLNLITMEDEENEQEQQSDVELEQRINDLLKIEEEIKIQVSK